MFKVINRFILLFFILSTYVLAGNSNIERAQVKKLIKRNKMTPTEVIKSITSDVRDLKELKELKALKGKLQVLKDESSRKKIQKRLDTVIGKIQDIIGKAFDYKKLSQETIAKGYWNKLDDTQKNRFIRLFSTLLKKVYSKKTEKLIEEFNLEFKEEKIDSKKNYAEVLCVVERKEVNIEIRYKMNQINGAWKIYDVEFDDSSLVKLYKRQFNRAIKKVAVQESFNKLLDKISKKSKTI